MKDEDVMYCVECDAPMRVNYMGFIWPCECLRTVRREPETPSPDVMDVWNLAVKAGRALETKDTHEFAVAAASVIAEAKARWEREAFEKAARVAEEPWLAIYSAPYNTPVEIKAGHMTFLARLLPGASMTHDEQPCDQWVAEHEGEHPPCWSDGACWEVNEEEAASLQPTAWRALSENSQ